MLKNMSLMPSPHHELGSQDDFIIDTEKQVIHQNIKFLILKCVDFMTTLHTLHVPNYTNIGPSDNKTLS